MKTQKSSVNSRELVLSVLMEIYAKKEFSHLLLRQILEKYDYLPVNEKAFIKRLTEGTLERTLQLDYVINQYSKVEVKKMKPLIRALLRMSVYQLLYLDNVPDSAVCNEAVKLAQNHRFSSLKGFVNGVLRTIARQKDNLPLPDENEEPLTRLSILYSMPRWLVEFFVNRYGEEKTERLLAAFLKEHPVTVRLWEGLTLPQREELKLSWKEAGIRVFAHPLISYAYVVEKLDGLIHMAGFREGWIAAQDVSSMLVSEVAGIERDMQILDVCAAPGGKAVHAALKLDGTGQVLARDISENKVEYIRENALRQKVNNLVTEVWDATQPDETREKWADIVFCDLPCSGLGIMGRKRDIKYRLSPEHLKEVTLLQQKILAAVWPCVKPGGILIYSTCTINEEENEKQVQWFTENFPFQVVSMKDRLPKALQEEEGQWGLQLLPGVHETDGFFLAKLRRNGE